MSDTSVGSLTIQEVRHTCGRLLIVVKLRGLELKCDKCGAKVIYTWRELLIMMLSAQIEEGARE